ncbi:hypothetical protein Dsin_006491 [Dipteronia sinensis]|uniref:SWIM-type domain-containing protein n=1 Tax=Dipteronia sinensis TaxID=43782 RepID=A0AAE0EFX6_9ROSI|nr:hypothetical protein Dsin_006491 [Dipteronia sinensis]
MFCFEEFDRRDKPSIEFELILVPNSIIFPEDQPPGLLRFNKQDNADVVEENNEENNVELVINGEPENVEYSEDNPVEDAVNDGSDGSAVDNEYKVDEESEDDSDVSLLDEKNGEKDSKNHDRCHPDGDETIVLLSSDNENGLTRVARYCRDHQCAPNPNGTIAFEAGQVIENATLTRDVIKRVTFMIKSVRGGHSMCSRVAENKEATSRWVASVLGNFIRYNPTDKLRLFKIELQDIFAVKVDSQTIYRAKRIVLETLKIHHVQAYAKLKKYGNAIRVMNPGTDVMVAMITHLRDSLGWDDSKRICFMSDRQKECLSVLENEWPDAYTRYYFRHIIANFKNHKMNGKLWHLARITNRAGFNETLASIRAESEKAANWLMLEPVEKWARHAFEPSIKSDHVSNNILECFNSWIKDHKDKPVLQLLENLRRKIMWYEIVDQLGLNILVNVDNGTCDCGMWQMSGLSCMHAIAVFMYKREFAHDHVHWYYSKQAWKMTYDGVINPIPDESRWPEF